MTAGARVAAVVVHYGEAAPTRRCLDSLAGFPEIVLVDQPPILFGEHPAVTRRIAADRNLGYAAACNLGVAATDAPFVLLLNNDTLVGESAGEGLAQALAGLDDDVAGACLKILDLDGRRLQSAGGLWFTADGIGFPHGFGELDQGQHDNLRPQEVGVPSGAAAVYRRSAWLEAGGMDEDFFCYCEDGDLGLRMVAAGHRFAWLPRVVVRHELSAASSAHSAFKAFHVERNHFATMLHVARVPRLAMLPLWAIARVGRMALDAARGRGAGAGLAGETSLPALAATLVRAWSGAARMLPASLAVRRELLLKDPEALRRVERFLDARLVPLAEFLRSRDSTR
ncbi:MAG: glycosyltransferase family 2 protein [Candidatus Binatia bacterium]